MSLNKIICITGNIASGKSTAVRYLLELGYPVVDADIIARQVVEPGSIGLKRIVENFGRDILSDTGVLDRGKLGNLIFSDSKKRQVLNDLLHPLIIDKIQEEAKEKLEKNKIVFLDIPLFFEDEKNLRNMSIPIDEVWLIYVDGDIQKKRLMVRDNIGEDAAEKKILSQMHISDKIKRADYVIHNNNSEAVFKRKIYQQISRVLVEVENEI